MYRIVVVEDEPHIRRGLSLFIPWDCVDCMVVGQAENAFRGSELIRQIEPDIAIVDIYMPGKSGIEMIRELRDCVSTEYIILSGYSDFEYARSAISLGVVDYLLKPIDEEQLIHVVKRSIERIEQCRSIEQLKRSVHTNENNPAYAGITRLLQQDNLYSKDTIVDQAIRIIEEESESSIRIKDVARSLNISESYLGKILSAKMGASFKEIQTCVRMKKAARLLKETDMRIYEIASKVGYKDVRYFSNIFRDIFGMNPTDFRNN